MKIVVITSIELRSIWKFFSLARYALDITRQLRKTRCLNFRKTGLWRLHYTMTLWESAEEMRDFAYNNGAHRDYMRLSSALSSEIRTITYEADTLPAWAEAKRLLREDARTRVSRYELG